MLAGTEEMSGRFSNWVGPQLPPHHLDPWRTLQNSFLVSFLEVPNSVGLKGESKETCAPTRFRQPGGPRLRGESGCFPGQGCGPGNEVAVLISRWGRVWAPAPEPWGRWLLAVYCTAVPG